MTPTDPRREAPWDALGGRDSIPVYGRDGSPISWDEYSRTAFEPANKRVDLDLVDDPVGRVLRVSTVWLGLDHSFGFGGPPLIFETMVFVEEDDVRDDDPRTSTWAGFQTRYPTEESAALGHRLVVEAIAQGRDPGDVEV